MFHLHTYMQWMGHVSSISPRDPSQNQETEAVSVCCIKWIHARKKCCWFITTQSTCTLAPVLSKCLANPDKFTKHELCIPNVTSKPNFSTSKWIHTDGRYLHQAVLGFGSLTFTTYLYPSYSLEELKNIQMTMTNSQLTTMHTGWE